MTTKKTKTTDVKKTKTAKARAKLAVFDADAPATTRKQQATREASAKKLARLEATEAPDKAVKPDAAPPAPAPTPAPGA